MRRAGRAVGIVSSIGVLFLLAWTIVRAPDSADDERRIERTVPDVDVPAPREVSTPRLAGDPTRAKTSGGPTGESVGPASAAAVEVGPVRIAGLVVDRTSGLALSRVPVALQWQGGQEPAPEPRAEVETGRNGTFEATLTVAGTATLTEVTFGRPGLRVGEWFPEGGRVGEAVAAKVGETARVVIRADETFDVAGVVVDEAGAPLEGVQVKYLFPPTHGGEGWGANWAHTGTDGRFAIANVLAHPEVAGNRVALDAAAFIDLAKPGFASVRFDTRSLPASERATVRVVLPRGRTIEGRLVDELGRTIAGIEVEAVYAGDDAARRTATTDESGRFRLEALTDGRVDLGAFVPAQETEARRTVSLTADTTDVELVARPIDLSDARRPVLFAGMRLVDVDDELRRLYGLADRVRVVILDPGANSSRLTGGPMRAGYGVLRVGDQEVASTKEVVERLLALDLTQSVRFQITYARTAGPEPWTNSQTLQLWETDGSAFKRRYAPTR